MIRFGALYIALLLFGGGIAPAQTPRVAAFYNVENLFDTRNDPGTDDGDFTPEGIYRWTEERYREKIGRISEVIEALEADLVGLAEVENGLVMEDLVTSVALKRSGYEYAHFDSPDRRGIDVALLYRPQRFRIEAMHPLKLPLLPGYRTRDILHVSGRWEGLPVQLLVCHLPSVLSPRQVRIRAAQSVRHYADSIRQASPGALLLVMGDFNANPGTRVMKELAPPLHNPFLPLYREGKGSYCYRGRWNMYDLILIGTTESSAFRTDAEIVIHPRLLQAEGRYLGYPYRSFSGHHYIGGYSDHLPVRLILTE